MSQYQQSSSEQHFRFGPYWGRYDLEAIPVADNIIDADRLFGPQSLINEAIGYGLSAVSLARTAVHGLAKVIYDGEPRAELFTAHGPQLNEQYRQQLRSSIYGLVCTETFQIVRNDIAAQQDERGGTIIVKGQASHREPLYLMDRPISTETRVLKVLSGHPDHMDKVTRAVNTFSLHERRAATAFVTMWTADTKSRDEVLKHANRYTTPDSDALYGASLFEMYGEEYPDALRSWHGLMHQYASRKNTVPDYRPDYRGNG